MSKPIGLVAAAAVSLAALNAAQAQPRPRFPTRLPPPSIAQAPPAPQQPAPEIAAPVPVTPAPPRAAPAGSIQAVELPPVAAPIQEAQSPAQTDVAPPPPAPVVEPPAGAGARLIHQVGVGDTLYAIGRRYGVGPQAVAEANGLTLEATLRLGQQIALPAGAMDRGPEAAFPGLRRPEPAAAAPIRSLDPPQSSTPAAPPRALEPTEVAPPARPLAVPLPPPVQPRALPSPGAAPVASPSEPTAPAPSVTSAPASQALSLAWPLRGQILAPFGPSGVGQRNDGLRISAPEGSPVRAAAPGRVVYAGDQVKGGYGKLVLVEHDGRWFTAYAHLGEIRVRMQDRVVQGQELGSVGRTGSVAAPQLYFEVRHAPTAGERARPVDPAPLLPE